MITVRKQSRITALIGALLGIIVAVLINAAYSNHPDGAGMKVPFWQPGLTQALQPALNFAASETVYPFYGRFAGLVFAALAVGLYGLYASLRGRTTQKLPRLAVWGYRLAMAGFILSILGNLGDYWIAGGEFLDFLSFLGGTLFGLLLIASGQILLGISGLRDGWMPKPSAWVMILWLPLTALFFLIGVGNIPAAPLLALSVAWLIVIATGKQTLWREF